MWPLQSQSPPLHRSNNGPFGSDRSSVSQEGHRSSTIFDGPQDPTSVSRAKPRPRRACDSCSSRKIKCSGETPCEPCRALDLRCTFHRPSRRRGPVNRYALAATRDGTSEAMPRTARAPSVHLESVAPNPPPAQHNIPLLVESICDIATMQTLINDYFTFIHPIIPLPHEPSFRAALARRDDRVDRGFVALLAAMLEILVASFPRRPLQAFTSAQAREQYPTAGALIDRCHKVFNEARGLGFNDHKACLNDALCSYLAGLAAGYVFDMSRQRRYLSECVVILRTLGFHRPESQSELQRPSGLDIDHIHQQSGRRLFWLCFVGSMSVRQLGGYDSDILMPPTAHAEKLPPLPVEVDDEYIYASHIFNQPPGIVPTMCGFNLNVRLFRSFHSLIALEVLFGGDTVYDWNRQRKLIRRALAEVKSVTQNAPKELQLAMPTHLNSPSPYDNGSMNTHNTGDQNAASNYLYTSDHTRDDPPSSDSQCIVKYEIQKANIYATQLATRSFLVEKFWNLYEIQSQEQPSPNPLNLDRPITAISPTAECIVSGLENRYHQNVGTPSDMYLQDGEQVMAIERENIVRDMALLLKNISQVNMEPNGLSFCNKIRQVASTLLNQDRMRMSVMPSLDAEAVNEYLLEFCNILAKLERLGPGRIRDSENSGRTTQVAEEEALVHWASLKEHQERFVRSEGFLAHANV